MKELLDKFPTGNDLLSLSDRELESALLKIVMARADGDGLTVPKFLSLGELENIYGVGLSLPADLVKQINERLAAAYQRLLSGNYTMPAPGQPIGVVTVTPSGRSGLAPAEKSLLEWAGGERVTLAIVFTDIVGSTALNVELGDAAMSEVRRQHFAQSTALLAKHAGYEVKTIGDSVMAVFRSVEAALGYTRALQAHPGSSELQVRAGIHIGPVEVTIDDVFGAEVALASRVAAAIAGAEIWLSSRAKEDVDRAGVFQKAQWQPHDVSLKGIGDAQLWCLEPTGAGQQPMATRLPVPARRPALKISVGETGPYFQTKVRGLYSTIRTLKLRLDNTSQKDAVTAIKVTILFIEPQSEYVGPWLLAENLTLAAGDHCFVPFVSYQEADTATGYSTTRYERSATFLEILTAGTQPKPPRDIAQFVTVRATGIGSAPCDYRCKIWVDRPDGRLRVAAAESPCWE